MRRVLPGRHHGLVPRRAVQPERPGGIPWPHVLAEALRPDAEGERSAHRAARDEDRIELHHHAEIGRRVFLDGEKLTRLLARESLDASGVVRGGQIPSGTSGISRKRSGAQAHRRRLVVDDDRMRAQRRRRGMCLREKEIRPAAVRDSDLSPENRGLTLHRWQERSDRRVLAELRLGGVCHRLDPSEVLLQDRRVPRLIGRDPLRPSRHSSASCPPG